MRKGKLKLFLVCTGLGHINRGYESFTSEIHEVLKVEQGLDLWLFKGAGNGSRREISLNCLKRESNFTKYISSVVKFDPYYLEQLSFFLALIPYVLFHRPKVILYSDFILGTYLFHFRKWLGFKYKLLLSNGAPNGPPFKTEDHVQQLLHYHYQNAISKGESPDKQTVIPYGIESEILWNDLSETDKNRIKSTLGLPLDKRIILSVGAINKNQKRMDYLVKEFSQMDSHNFFLLMVGQISDGTKEIELLANSILPMKNFMILQLGKNDMPMVYRIADAFILASLSEGLPRVLLEALNEGLPIGVHDYPLVREILGENGYYADFTQEGNLFNLLKIIFHNTNHSSKSVHSYCYEKYSWEMLKPRYLEMIYKVAGHD